MENPGSFLRGLPDAKEILLSCGVACRECGDTASDYEFFRAFCKSQKKLSHNRLTLAARALLAKNGCRAQLSEKTADEIWRYFANLNALALPEQARFSEERTDELPDRSLKASDFLSLDKVLERAKTASTPEAFESLLAKTFSESGKCGVLIDLPEDFYGRQPNLYALGRALEGKEDSAVLFLQAIRRFAKDEVPMLLFLQGSGESALAFFLRLASLVGLPELFLAIAPASFENALDFLFGIKQEGIRPVLTVEHSSAIASPLYYRYPMGNCCLLLQDLCRKSCKNH